MASVVVFAAALATGCQDDPTEEDARRIYAENAATLQAVDEEIRALVGGIPGAGGAPPPCEAPSATATTDEIRGRVACQAGMFQYLEDRNAAVLATRERALALLEHRGVVGVDVRWAGADAPDWAPLFSVALVPPGTQKGATEAANGVSIDERRVGWGRYQTAYRHGDGALVGDGDGRVGIEVVWTFPVGTNRYRANVFLLADYQPSDEWRAGWR